MKILHLEDNRDDASLVRELLLEEWPGCEITVVSTKPEFVGEIQRPGYEVILSDFNLGSFTGLEALQLTLQHQPDVPFIFLSGTIGEERAIEALRRGAVDYVLKTNPARLAPAVRRALREVAERRRRRFAELRIRESEQRLRDIIDTAQDWIWELAAGGRYVFNSESVRGMLGHASEDINGTHFSDYIHEEDSAAFSDTLGA